MVANSMSSRQTALSQEQNQTVSKIGLLLLGDIRLSNPQKA
jgi:hypothetical protein